jgi:hypothetical protein
VNRTEFKAHLVEIANDVQTNLLDGTMTPVYRLIEASDLVLAVWQDAEEPDGVGMYVIKGDRLLRTIIAENKAMPAKMTAVPCECLEQAVALKQVAGEPDAHH